MLARPQYVCVAVHMTVQPLPLFPRLIGAVHGEQGLPNEHVEGVFEVLNLGEARVADGSLQTLFVPHLASDPINYRN